MISACHTAIRVLIALALLPVALWVIWCGICEEDKKRRYEEGEI
jgi:hypothetical protein